MSEDLSKHIVYCPSCLKLVCAQTEMPPQNIAFERCETCKGREQELPDLIDSKVISLFEILRVIYTVHGGEWDDSPGEPVVTAILLLAAVILRGKCDQPVAIPIPVPVHVPTDIQAPNIDVRKLRIR